MFCVPPQQFWYWLGVAAQSLPAQLSVRVCWLRMPDLHVKMSVSLLKSASWILTFMAWSSHCCLEQFPVLEETMTDLWRILPLLFSWCRPFFQQRSVFWQCLWVCWRGLVEPLLYQWLVAQPAKPSHTLYQYLQLPWGICWFGDICKIGGV